MKKAKDRHQGIRPCKGRCCFTILNSLFLILFLWSGEAMAVAVQTCNTASITASTPTADFVDNGNGTVTDKKTGLMWKQCSEGLSGAGCATGSATIYTWQGALQNGAGSGFAGFTDWRVANKKELNSIVEVQCFNPSINATIFPAASGFYWSASPYAGAAPFAWGVNFYNGRDGTDLKGNNFYVRLVRGGQ